MHLERRTHDLLSNLTMLKGHRPKTSPPYPCLSVFHPWLIISYPNILSLIRGAALRKRIARLGYTLS
jgi:hypothetical protein